MQLKENDSTTPATLARAKSARERKQLIIANQEKEDENNNQKLKEEVILYLNRDHSSLRCLSISLSI